MSEELVWRSGMTKKDGVPFNMLHIHKNRFTVTIRLWDGIISGNYAEVEVREFLVTDPSHWWCNPIHREEHRNTDTTFLEQRAVALLRRYSSRPPAKSRRKVRCA